LIKAHAYPIIKAEEINGNRMITMRNPWGKPLNFKNPKNVGKPDIKKVTSISTESSTFTISFEELC
jgi:hypothetical protein